MDATAAAVRTVAVIVAARVAVDQATGLLHHADLQVVKRAEIISADLVNRHLPALQIAGLAAKVQCRLQDVFAAVPFSIQAIVVQVCGIQLVVAVEAHHRVLHHRYGTVTPSLRVQELVDSGAHLLVVVTAAIPVQRAHRLKSGIVVHNQHVQEPEAHGAQAQQAAIVKAVARARLALRHKYGTVTRKANALVLVETGALRPEVAAAGAARRRAEVADSLTRAQ